MLKKIWKKWGPNPFELILKGAVKKKSRSFLICWNRGLGDIALGLYALVYRIREVLPDAEITFLTRKDLKEGFLLLNGVDVIVAPHWKRGDKVDATTTLLSLKLSPSAFDVIVENPDPTHWVKWQLGTLTPRLKWDASYDDSWKKFGLDPLETYVAVHVQTETSYSYEKNWLVKSWYELFQKLTSEHKMKILLFGMQPTHSFPIPGVIDLRGKTRLLEMLSIIKNRCAYLIAPDSGVLSLIYFLDLPFSLKVVSLWSDPRQGILKQAVSSPNPHLSHYPMIGKEGDLSFITVDDVLTVMTQKDG